MEYIKDGITAVQAIEKYAPDKLEKDFILSVRSLFRSRALLYAFEHFNLSYPICNDEGDEILPESIAKIVIDCEVCQASLKYPQFRYSTRCFASPPDVQSMILIPTFTYNNLINSFTSIYNELQSYRKKKLLKSDDDEMEMEIRMTMTDLRNQIVHFKILPKHDFPQFLEEKYTNWGNCIIKFELSKYGDIPITVVIYNDTKVENQDLFSIKTIFVGEKLCVTDL